MARPRDEQLWALVHAERAALAKELAGLGIEQWRHRTLCGEWDVEQVVAHLTAAASLNQWKWLRSMAAARFRPDVHNQRRLAEYCGSTPAETLDRFRAVITSTTAPSGALRPTSARLSCTRKKSVSRWGFRRHHSAEALTPVANFFAGRNFAVASRTHVAGLQLKADDGPFAAGTGTMVTGSTLALVMGIAGRVSYLAELDGPGVPTLRSRLSASSQGFEQLASSIPGRKQRMASLVLKMSVSLDGYVAPIDGSTDWIAAGGSADAPQLDRRDREQRQRAPHRCRHLHRVGRLLAQRLRAVRQANERDPQGRVLELARIRRLGRDGDRRRRPGRSRHAAQAGSAQTGTCSPTAGPGSPGRWSRPA